MVHRLFDILRTLFGSDLFDNVHHFWEEDRGLQEAAKWARQWLGNGERRSLIDPFEDLKTKFSIADSGSGVNEILSPKWLYEPHEMDKKLLQPVVYLLSK